MVQTIDPRVVVLLAADHDPDMQMEMLARVDVLCLDCLGIVKARPVLVGLAHVGIFRKGQRRRFGDLVLLRFSLGHRQSLR